MESIPADGGPIYTETRLESAIAEPFNAATALLFLILAVYWFRRIWPERGKQRLLTLAAPVVAIGGVGGTLYHALRIWRGFLLMDVLPILFLCVVSGAHFAKILLGSWWRVSALIAPLVAVPQLLFYLARRGAIGLPPGAIVNVSYAALALVVAGPITWLTLSRAAAHWRFLPISLGSFALALGFRVLDGYSADILPIGTHWLWHVFGAVATFAMLELIYRVKRDLHTEPRALVRVNPSQ